MQIEAAISQTLNASGGITALVGDAIYPGIAPQRGGDCIVFWSPEDGREFVESLEGGIWLVRDRLYFSSYAKTFGGYLKASQMDTAIFTLLTEARGQVASDDSPADTIEIQNIVPLPRPQHAYQGWSDRTEFHHFLSGFEIAYLLVR